MRFDYLSQIVYFTDPELIPYQIRQSLCSAKILNDEIFSVQKL
jgi:hypothetical protein